MDDADEFHSIKLVRSVEWERQGEGKKEESKNLYFDLTYGSLESILYICNIDSIDSRVSGILY